MNKQDRRKIPEKITSPIISPNKVVPIDDSSIRALKKGGKSTSV